MRDTGDSWKRCSNWRDWSKAVLSVSTLLTFSHRLLKFPHNFHSCPAKMLLQPETCVFFLYLLFSRKLSSSTSPTSTDSWSCPYIEKTHMELLKNGELGNFPSGRMFVFWYATITISLLSGSMLVFREGYWKMKGNGIWDDRWRLWMLPSCDF